MNNKFLITILITVVIGMLSGVTGYLIARVYILEDAFGVPFFGEVDFDNSTVGNSSLIIREAKNVVVEQNDKVIEVANSAKRSMLGIYEKIETNKKVKGEKGAAFDGAYYDFENPLALGFVLTSDGWLITNFLPKELKEDEVSTSTISKLSAEYVFIDKNKEVFEVESVVIDRYSEYNYWKVKAKELPVKVFSEDKDVVNGQIVLSVNWKDQVWIDNILNKRKDKELIKSSDDYFENMYLNNPVQEEFLGSFLFGLNGSLLGLINSEGLVEPIYNFTSCIDCLLRGTEIKRASLGIDYINLSEIISLDEKMMKKGALVVKNNAGLLERKDEDVLIKDDIIVSIDNYEIDEDLGLSEIIRNYNAGDEVSIKIVRKGEEKTILFELAELE